jgi:hypothetical protein
MPLGQCVAQRRSTWRVAVREPIPGFASLSVRLKQLTAIESARPQLLPGSTAELGGVFFHLLQRALHRETHGIPEIRPVNENAGGVPFFGQRSLDDVKAWAVAVATGQRRERRHLDRFDLDVGHVAVFTLLRMRRLNSETGQGGEHAETVHTDCPFLVWTLDLAFIRLAQRPHLEQSRAVARAADMPHAWGRGAPANAGGAPATLGGDDALCDGRYAIFRYMTFPRSYLQRLYLNSRQTKRCPQCLRFRFGGTAARATDNRAASPREMGRKSS